MVHLHRLPSLVLLLIPALAGCEASTEERCTDTCAAFEEAGCDTNLELCVEECIERVTQIPECGDEYLAYAECAADNIKVDNGSCPVNLEACVEELKASNECKEIE